MTRFLAALLALLTLTLAPPAAAQSEWDNVSRVVAIGDLEGDYEKFTDMLRTAGLIDPRERWIGGTAHLVQLGDIPDRGPNSRRVMDLLMRLEREAERAGGRVHALIGNHEAMNVMGDLRYVHPGEYAAFADRNSERRRTQFYERTIERLRAAPPAEGLPVFDAAYRAQWDAEHPLGWVEHRVAWGPAGTYGRWIASHDSVIRINDTLYLHAGLGAPYVAATRDGMNDAVRAVLRDFPASAQVANIAEDENGPLWYRGFALNDETAEAPHLAAVMQAQGVAHIVTGHTKLASTVLPRFGGRVLIADIAVPEGYSDPHAFLIQENGAFVTVHRGQRVPLGERCAYLAAIAALDPPGGPNARLATQCAAAAAATTPAPQN